MALTYPAGTTPVLPVLQSDTFEIQRQKINNLTNASFGPTFLAIKQLIYTSSGQIVAIGPIAVSAATLATYGVPSTATALILEAYCAHGNTNTVGFVYITGATPQKYVLMSYYSGGSGDTVANSGQGTFPITATSGFTYQITVTDGGGSAMTINLLGYY